MLLSSKQIYENLLQMKNQTKTKLLLSKLPHQKAKTLYLYRVKKKKYDLLLERSLFSFIYWPSSRMTINSYTIGLVKKLRHIGYIYNTLVMNLSSPFLLTFGFLSSYFSFSCYSWTCFISSQSIFYIYHIRYNRYGSITLGLKK